MKFKNMLFLLVIITSATFLTTSIYAQDQEINSINNKFEGINKMLSLPELPEKKDLDRSQFLVSESRIGFVLPTFTMAAYHNSFYTFFEKYVKEKPNVFVTTDLDLLSSGLLNSEQSFKHSFTHGLHKLRDYTSSLLPNAHLTYLADQDIHNGFIFAQDKSNLYDILVLGHSEYVTQQEYNNFKKFVENGGTIILIDANMFYAEVAYDPTNNKISLVKGHDWGFDGTKAWKDVKERWANETTEWVGSNYLCTQCTITFNNNPFSYTHHEENSITNPNVKILIDYEAPQSKNKIAAHELQYGLGKVIGLGIFGSNVVHNNNFLTFYKDLILSNI